MTLILCGLPSCGKTTFGKRLSEELNCLFVDTDRLIESAYTATTGKQLSCRQIFTQEGAAYFRALERQEVTRLPPSPLEKTVFRVIATGGGTLETPENLNYLKQLGKLIYLQVPLDILWERIVLTGLPAYVDPQDPRKSFYEIAQRRISLYDKAADWIVEIEGFSTHPGS